MVKIGAQLFSLRDYMKNLDDFSETLKKVADMGYEHVQVSAACAFEPEWLNNELKKNGLGCEITHSSFDRMIEMPETVCKEHKAFNCTHIGVGMMPNIGKENTIETWKSFCDKALPAAKVFKANGCYMMYHNHWHEFVEVDGKRAIDYILDTFSPDLLGITLDTFWVENAKQSATQWLEKLNGRIPCIHFKDGILADKRFTPVGDGELNWDKIIQTVEKLDVDYAYVEQDNCFGEDPFACMKRSREFLKSMGL